MPPVTEKFALSELAGEGIAVSDSGGLRLQGQAQPIRGAKGVEDGTQTVSVFLVNYRAADNSPGYRDRGYVFQVELELHCAEGFVRRPDPSPYPGDHEQALFVVDWHLERAQERARSGAGVGVALACAR